MHTPRARAIFFYFYFIHILPCMCQVSLFFGNFGSGCESHSVGGVGGFVPFDPFFAMPAVTIAFKYEEQAMTNFSNFQ